jgi:hypothetical protein
MPLGTILLIIGASAYRSIALVAVLGRLGASASRYSWRCAHCGLDPSPRRKDLGFSVHSQNTGWALPSSFAMMLATRRALSIVSTLAGARRLAQPSSR